MQVCPDGRLLKEKKFASSCLLKKIFFDFLNLIFKHFLNRKNKPTSVCLCLNYWMVRKKIHYHVHKNILCMQLYKPRYILEILWHIKFITNKFSNCWMLFFQLIHCCWLFMPYQTLPITNMPEKKFFLANFLKLEVADFG